MRVLLLATAVCIGAAGATGAAAHALSAPPDLKVEVIGKGKVTGSGASCGESALACYVTYSSSTTATLTATAASGWTFVGWQDDAASCGATAANCAVTVNSDQTATAVFSASGAVASATFSVSTSGGGTVTDKSSTSGSSANSSINCSQGTTPATDCSLTTLVASTITVDEQPDSGSLFAGWGGACSGTRVSCSVYLNADRSVGASFVSNTPKTLTVTVSGAGSVSGGGISCGAGSTCDASEAPNSSVTLTATAQSGYAFTSWSGDCSGDQPTCSVHMDSDHKVTATFAKVVPVLVSVNGNGTVSGGGISCGPGPATCTAGVAPGTSVLFTATPGVAGAGVSWAGCSSTSGSICSVSVNSTPVSITATFSGGTTPPGPPPSYTLSVDVTGDGYVSSSTPGVSIWCTAAGGSACSVSVQQNTTVTLTATPATGTATDFSRWAGDCSSATTSSCTLTMNGSKSIAADFNGADTTYNLTATLAGSGSGTISGAGLNCTASGGASCTSPEAAGAALTLTANASFGSTFSGWSGACSGSGSSCKVTMSAAKSVTATFSASGAGSSTSTSTPALTMTVKGAGTVDAAGATCTSAAGKTTVCTASFATGTKVALTATPANGYAFAGWKGACSGAKTSCSLTLSAARSVSATFVPVLLVAGHRPTVAKTRGGYRITLYYKTYAAGTIKLTGKVKGSRVGAQRARVRIGTHKLTVTVKKRGRYVFTLTLTTKAGTSSLRFTVKA